MNVFRKGTVICLVNQNQAENIDKFIDRGNFIVSQKPQNNKEYDKAVLYSNIYSNVKYLSCEYSVGIMKELREMEKKL